jgi:hypothetical protein
VFTRSDFTSLVSPSNDGKKQEGQKQKRSHRVGAFAENQLPYNRVRTILKLFTEKYVKWSTG